MENQKIQETFTMNDAIDMRKKIIMPVGTSFYAKVVSIIKTKLMMKQIKKMNKEDIALSIIKEWNLKGVAPITSLGKPEDFPNINKRIEEFKTNIVTYAKKVGSSPLNQKDVNIAVGDSLTDFFRGCSSNIDDLLNFGIAGTSSIHFEYVLKQLVPVIIANGLKIKNLLIGCFIGNALLAHEDYSIAISDMSKTLSTARNLLPDTKFLLYGLPPVYDVYAMSFQEVSRAVFISFIKTDKNSVYLDIEKTFAGAYGLLPKVEYSLEGVHMTPEAKWYYDRMIDRGIKATPGSIIVGIN